MGVLATEFILLFFILPSFFAWSRVRIPMLLALWAVFAYCALVLARNDRLALAALRPSDFLRLPEFVVAIVALGVAIDAVFVRELMRFNPRLLFNFPRSSPKLWALVMVLYPLLSVYPQGVIYRAFFFERYAPLFGSPVLTTFASAVAFSYAHIIFRNRVSLLATFAGGIIFSALYAATGSLILSSFAHAFFGCIIFTVGLGQWFYYRATFAPPAA